MLIPVTRRQFTANANNSVINVGTLQTALATNNVIVRTGSGGGEAGNITVAAALTWTASTTLSLQAHNNISINAPITAVNGGLTINAGGNVTAPAAINVGTFTLANGNWTQNSATLPAFHATDFRITGGSFLRVTGGNGSSENPYQITDVYGLQGIGSSTRFLERQVATCQRHRRQRHRELERRGGLQPDRQRSSTDSREALPAKALSLAT